MRWYIPVTFTEIDSQNAFENTDDVHWFTPNEMELEITDLPSNGMPLIFNVKQSGNKQKFK